MLDIIDAFKARLPDVPWMDHESAKAAAKKVSQIDDWFYCFFILIKAELRYEQAGSLYVKIGYPTSPNTTDAIALKNYYSRLVIDDDFFANGLRQR